MTFKRENKYLVVKWEDIEKYLSEDQQLQLQAELTNIRIHRLHDGKPDHQYVVIVDDSPIYETVWQLLEAEQTGKPNQIEQLQQENLQLLAAIALKDEALGYWCKFGDRNLPITAVITNEQALAIQPDAIALSQYAKRIADAVEKLTVERCAKVCDQQKDEPECPERAAYCADEIRALPLGQIDIEELGK